MAFSSFAHFVQALDHAGELVRIREPVATELEITELANRQMKAPGGGKALLIEKPTVNGQVSPFPVAINTMGSWKRMAISMGAESVDDVAAELGSLIKAKPPTSFREALKLFGTAIEMRHARPKRVTTGAARSSSADASRFTHSEVLAARRGTFYYVALRSHSRSRYW